MPDVAWPEDPDGLVALQEELRGRAAEVLRNDPFRLPPASSVLIGGCFVAFARGEAGPGRTGDRAFAAAVVWEPGHDALLRRGRGAVEQAVVQQAVGSAYLPGLLALREGPVLAAAVGALRRRPDVLLVDASGADHPRRAGLAVHLGWALGLPTVGVTHSPLRAALDTAAVADLSDLPAARVRGRWWPLHLGGEPVAALVCTRTGARPVVAHAGWRTDVEAAVAVALAASTEGARAPVPLQEARRVARQARDLDEREL